MPAPEPAWSDQSALGQRVVNVEPADRRILGNAQFAQMRDRRRIAVVLTGYELVVVLLRHSRELIKDCHGHAGSVARA